MKVRRYRDPVVERYLRDVDRTLLRENLKLTHAQRLEKFIQAHRLVSALKGIGVKPGLGLNHATNK